MQKCVTTFLDAPFLVGLQEGRAIYGQRDESGTLVETARGVPDVIESSLRDTMAPLVMVLDDGS